MRAVLPLTAVVMEFCWAYPWVLLLTGAFYGRTPTPLLPARPAFVLLTLGYLTVRAALARSWSLRAVRIVVVAAGLVAGLLSVKATYYSGYIAVDPQWLMALLRSAHDALPVVVPPVVGALTATALWWRGVVLGEREFNYFEVDRAFRRGVGWSIAFVLLFAVYGDSRGFGLAQSAPAYLMAFFSLGLVTLAIARLLGIWQEIQADEDQALAMNRHWLLLLVGVVGLVFLAATWTSGMVRLELRPVLLEFLRPLEPVVEFVFLIIFAVAVVVARAILFVFSRLPFRGAGARPQVSMPDTIGDLLKDLPPRVVSGVRWGMVFLVIAVLLVLVAIVVVRARRRARKGEEDEREWVWSTEAALAGLGTAWRSLWVRLRGARRAHEQRELPAVGAMRAIYRELLRLGTALGVPRLVHQTPYEYRPRLVERLPGGANDVGALTEVYVRVRYTPHIPAGDEIAEAQAALARIRERVLKGND